ncbi:hypothetical protein L6452_35748 [Arctium lappa]|uniref:Uncharacterized protein n=1 Tax=Arctium lappa TaxID=4217 RepID=A0ACB8Y8G1_ARCLA|nr:hypothetical protein L6452_35748 [Arctium lappa]
MVTLAPPPISPSAAEAIKPEKEISGKFALNVARRRFAFDSAVDVISFIVIKQLICNSPVSVDKGIETISQFICFLGSQKI